MAADPRDARFTHELTPLPPDDFGPDMTPAEADLAVARATCESQRLALAALQARLDEKDTLIVALRADRRALADRVRYLEAVLRSL